MRSARSSASSSWPWPLARRSIQAWISVPIRAAGPLNRGSGRTPSSRSASDTSRSRRGRSPRTSRAPTGRARRRGRRRPRARAGGPRAGAWPAASSAKRSPLAVGQELHERALLGERGLAPARREHAVVHLRARGTRPVADEPLSEPEHGVLLVRPPRVLDRRPASPCRRPRPSARRGSGSASSGTCCRRTRRRRTRWSVRRARVSATYAVRRSSMISWALQRRAERGEVAVVAGEDRRVAAELEVERLRRAPPGSAACTGFGSVPCAKPGTKTWSNSSPFATWIVITFTESSDDGCDERPLGLVELLDRVDVVEEGTERELALDRREGVDLVEEGGQVATRRAPRGHDRGRRRAPRGCPIRRITSPRNSPTGRRAWMRSSASSWRNSSRRSSASSERPLDLVEALERLGEQERVGLGVVVGEAVVLAEAPCLLGGRAARASAMSLNPTR